MLVIYKYYSVIILTVASIVSPSPGIELMLILILLYIHLYLTPINFLLALYLIEHQHQIGRQFDVVAGSSNFKGQMRNAKLELLSDFACTTDRMFVQ